MWPKPLSREGRVAVVVSRNRLRKILPRHGGVFLYHRWREGGIPRNKASIRPMFKSTDLLFFFLFLALSLSIFRFFGVTSLLIIHSTVSTRAQPVLRCYRWMYLRRLDDLNADDVRRRMHSQWKKWNGHCVHIGWIILLYCSLLPTGTNKSTVHKQRHGHLCALAFDGHLTTQHVCTHAMQFCFPEEIFCTERHLNHDKDQQIKPH